MVALGSELKEWWLWNKYKKNLLTRGSFDKWEKKWNKKKESHYSNIKHPKTGITQSIITS